MGHRLSESALPPLTFLTPYLLEENPYFCELLLKGKKDFQSFPHSLYIINCTKSIQNKSQFLLTNQCKFFCQVLFCNLILWKQGKKNIFKVSSEIKPYPLFFNTQKLIASEDMWEHFLSSNTSVLAINVAYYHLSLQTDTLQAFLVYPLKSCNTCSSAFFKLADLVD